MDVNLPHRRDKIKDAGGRRLVLEIQELLRLPETDYHVRRCAFPFQRHHTHDDAGLPGERGNFRGGDVDDEDP